MEERATYFKPVKGPSVSVCPERQWGHKTNKNPHFLYVQTKIINLFAKHSSSINYIDCAWFDYTINFAHLVVFHFQSWAQQFKNIRTENAE